VVGDGEFAELLDEEAGAGRVGFEAQAAGG